jgi:hypothetical protein
VRLAGISEFAGTQFSSDGRGFWKLGSRSLQKFLFVRAVVCLFGAVIPTPGLAQSRPAAVFRFSKEVRWGRAVLRPGDYVVSVSGGPSQLVTVCQRGGAFAAAIAPSAVSSEPFSGNTRVVMNDNGTGSFVITSLYVENTRTVLTFAAANAPAPTQAPGPGAQDLARPSAISGDSAVGDSGFFTIFNPRNQALPYGEAQALYLSACKVVEQEFSRTDPIRPRVTLILGAERDAIYYPKREIHLMKWDKYQFAQGVVVLAVNEMLPADMRISLTKLAVLEAESTVSVDQLKK